MNIQITKRTSTFIVLAVLVSSLSVTFIEKTFNLSITLLYIPLALLIVLLSAGPAIKHFKKMYVRLPLLLLMLTVISTSKIISKKIFLGDEILYCYEGESPGFEELYLYSRGDCMITAGGIFGVSDVQYGTYIIRGNLLLTERVNSGFCYVQIGKTSYRVVHN
jgi:hypothetical protein